MLMDFVFLYCIIPIVGLSFIMGYIYKKTEAFALTDKPTIELIFNIITNHEHFTLYGFLALIYIIILVVISSLISYRHVGKEINFSYVLGRLRSLKWRKFLRKNLTITLAIILVFCFLLAPGASAHGLALLLGYRDIDIPVFYSISFVIVFLGLSVYIYLREYFTEKSFKARLQRLKNSNIEITAVLQAQTHEELQYFLRNIDLGIAEVRSLLRLLRSPPSYQAYHPIYGLNLFKLDWNENKINEILNILMLNLNFIFLQDSNS